MVNRNSEPSCKLIGICTRPFPYERLPTINARSLSCNAPATISAAEALSTPSNSSSTPFFYPVVTAQLEANATELQLAVRCAASRGGLRPLAKVVELNGETSPQPCRVELNGETSPQPCRVELNGEASSQPCRVDCHNPDSCEAEGHKPPPCQEGLRLASLAACGGSEAQTPVPLSENPDEGKERPRYDLAQMRAAMRKANGDYSTPQPVAAPPLAKRPLARDRYRAAVEDVEQLSIYNRTAQRTEMDLGKVARFLQTHAKDLPTSWTVGDLHAAFSCSEFYGAQRLSWGWIISKAVWPRFTDVVARAHANRKEREASLAASIAKAEAAAASDDPAQRATAGYYFLFASVNRPLEGVPLLLEALYHTESVGCAARWLQEWALHPTGGEVLAVLAVDRLKEFLEGYDDDSSPVRDARLALELLLNRALFELAKGNPIEKQGI